VKKNRLKMVVIKLSLLFSICFAHYVQAGSLAVERLKDEVKIIDLDTGSLLKTLYHLDSSCKCNSNFF